jgi:hypothetical protein
MTILRLEPPIELDTPRGRADAYFVIDYASDGNLVWVTFLRGSGECWSFQNPVVRKPGCETMGTGAIPVVGGWTNYVGPMWTPKRDV